MKFPSVVPRLSLLVLAFTVLLSSYASAQQGAYRIGDIVTNFALPNRYLWTNDNGQVFTPGNTSWRLSDFAGKIAFIEVFAVW